MITLFSKTKIWARKASEFVAVMLMTAMFSFFLLQIFTRYILNDPLSWTSEASTIIYIWVIFWGGTFLLRNDEHVRFSILQDAASPFARVIFSFITLFAIALAFIVGLPGIWDYISFMKIERSPILGIRFDYLFSIFLLFSIALIIRNLSNIISLFKKWSERSSK